ncbi:MAG TPA: hypothetical protein VGC54_11600 [Planctomycetota bacterium]
MPLIPFALMLSILPVADLASQDGGATGQDPAVAPQAEPATAWEVVARYDADRDGRVSAKEYPRGEERFARLDRDADGFLTPADFASPAPRRGQERSAAVKPREAPAKGELAPDFTLPLLGAKKPSMVTLADFRGKKPVALIFGSYT